MDQHPGLALFTLFGAFCLYRVNRKLTLLQEETEYEGSCHCGAVQFTVEAPMHLTVWNCNCSICYMKKNWHFIVPSSSFHNYKGEDALTEYRFNTKQAKHMFCKYCGVQAYYVPRSNPDGIAVTLSCIKPEQVNSLFLYSCFVTHLSLFQLISYEIINYDGQNWEQFFSKSSISKFSKAKN
jgi:hypothetical protein